MEQFLQRKLGLGGKAVRREEARDGGDRILVAIDSEVAQQVADVRLVVELSTKPLELPVLAQQLDSIVELCARFSPESVVVLYGWACNLDVPDLWQEMPTPTSALRAFIRESMERGVYDLGESDMYIQDPDEIFQFLLCHESDIHFRSTDQALLNIVKAAWQDAGLEPFESEPQA